MFSFLRRVINSKEIIFSLARNEVRQRYTGTAAGAIWAIMQPLSVITVFWFVFSVGFKAVGPNNMPFLAYFLPAFIAWMYFSEVVNNSPQMIISKSYLVKKTIFPSEILPIISLISLFWVHLIIVGISLLVIVSQGYLLTWKILLLPLPLGLLLVMALGLGWLISSINVFYRDAGQVVLILTNMWFWMTPIVWAIDIVPTTYRFLFELNPFYLIVEGYRFALIDSYVFPGRPLLWISAFICAFGSLLIGGLIFRRLKLEFADEL